MSPVEIPLRYSQGIEFFDALGLPQVRWQDLRGELLSFASWSSVVDAGLLDFELSQTGSDLSLVVIAIADHLAMAFLVGEMRRGSRSTRQLPLQWPWPASAGLLAREMSVSTS